jgi:hypothetical protein
MESLDRRRRSPHAQLAPSSRAARDGVPRGRQSRSLSRAGPAPGIRQSQGAAARAGQAVRTTQASFAQARRGTRGMSPKEWRDPRRPEHERNRSAPALLVHACARTHRSGQRAYGVSPAPDFAPRILVTPCTAAGSAFSSPQGQCSSAVPDRTLRGATVLRASSIESMTSYDTKR